MSTFDAVLKDELRTARKTYSCDASACWLEAGMGEQDCKDAGEIHVYRAASEDGFKILPGQTYRYVRGVFEGSIHTWRARPEMQALCDAHELYED